MDDAAAAARPGLWRRAWALPRNVLAIGFVSLLNDASSEIVYPFLPLFLSMLGATPFAIGLIEGGAESLSGLLKLFSGYFSDRRGRRKGLVVFGYGLASVMRPLIGFATSAPQVLAVRLADRVGKGVRSAPRDAMIADAAAPSDRGLAFGFHRAMDHTGAVVGPLLGYFIMLMVAADKNAPTAADYRTLFLVASIPALFAVLVAAFFLRDAPRANGANGTRTTAPPPPTTNTSIVTATPVSAAAGASPGPARLSLRGFDSNFKRFLVILVLFTLSNSTDAFLLLRAKEAGVGAAAVPLLWAALHVCKVASSLWGGDLSDRLGRKTLIASGWLVYAAVYAGFAFVSTPGATWALFLVYGVYFGLVEGAEKALVADLVAPERRGTAYGLYNLAFSVAVLPASLLFGKLWQWYDARTAFLASAALSVLSALLLALLVRPQAREA